MMSLILAIIISKVSQNGLQSITGHWIIGGKIYFARKNIPFLTIVLKVQLVRDEKMSNIISHSTNIAKIRCTVLLLVSELN